MGILAIVEQVFRERKSFFGEIKANQGLERKLLHMIVVTLASLFLCGLTLGIPGGIVQCIASAVKLPVLYALSLLIALPAFYFFNLFAGSRLTFAQTLALILTAAMVAGILSLSLAPVSVFFWVSAPNYLFFKLLNVTTLSISAALGVVFLFQGTLQIQQDISPRARKALLWAWAVVFALVGTQLAWALRPFFGSPRLPFQLFRAVGGNFFVDVARSLFSFLVSLFPH
jgi:hypothetical protein